LQDENKEERYSRVPRLSDTRYSAKWRYASSKARLKCATYRRKTDLSVMGVRVGMANFFLDQSIGVDENNTFQLKLYIYRDNCGRHRLGRFVGVKVGVAIHFS